VRVSCLLKVTAGTLQDAFSFIELSDAGIFSRRKAPPDAVKPTLKSLLQPHALVTGTFISSFTGLI
jgi:hypothetical protein